MNVLLRYKFIWMVSVVLLVITSCVKPDEFPPEPKIEFNGYEIMGDSLLISIKFEDGDGDIGLSPADTTGDFSQESFYHYNFYAEYYEMMDGEWVKGTVDPSGNNFPTADTITFGFRIKNLTPKGQNKALKATLNVNLNPLFYNPESNHSDSIKYRIRLIDRALNESNLVETPLIVR